VLTDEVTAIRRSVAVSNCPHVAAVRIRGAGAFDALDSICPRELYIQEGQALQTLLLDGDGRAVADVYVLAGADDFLVLGEAGVGSIMEYLRDRIGQKAGVELDDLSSSHRVMSLNGPYAWEFLTELITPEIIGLPYLGFFQPEGLTCLRAGKAGEYGYDLLVPNEGAGDLWTQIQECGESFDLGVASLEALDACALENWFFNVRREGRADVTPIEMQLQWRVSYRRDYPGAAALLARRKAGAKRRAVLVSSELALDVGAQIVWDDRLVGELIASGPSPSLGASLGIALLDAPFAHAGLSAFAATRGESRVPLRTLSAPPINNRSLYVDPQRHNYRTRETDIFPPVGKFI